VRVLEIERQAYADTHGIGGNDFTDKIEALSRAITILRGDDVPPWASISAELIRRDKMRNTYPSNHAIMGIPCWLYDWFRANARGPDLPPIVPPKDPPEEKPL
jgi:hypothetical protein